MDRLPIYYIIYIYDYERECLNECLDKARGNACKRCYQTREIDLAEDALIASECILSCSEAGIEIVPKQSTAHIEQCLRNAASAYACQSGKDKHIHDGRENRLKEEPQRSKDGLFIDSDDIALDEHTKQISILPNTFEINIEEFLSRFYYQIPVFFFCHNNTISVTYLMLSYLMTLLRLRHSHSRNHNHSRSHIRSRSLQNQWHNHSALRQWLH